ncbi:MAG: alkaline phosphatase D family protein, partial [Bdellovibrionales bacterium]
FAFIGDNIYADTEDMSVMRSKYQMLGRIAGFRRFRAKIPMIFTWDDHDFGINDGGREYPFKAESKKIMFQFFGEDLASPRARRDGVYTSYVFGKAPRRTQIILLDLRWFRSALIATENGYIPNPDPDATMLGAEQWKWLEEQLRIPADFRILASSTQFVSSEHGWEKWANFPHEKARLLRLIDELNIKNLAIISGDMHYGELSMETTPGGFNLYDLSSSGLNFTEPALGIPNSKRLGIFDADSNFGMVSVDFANPESILVTLEVRDSLGETVIQRKLEYPRGPALTS